MPSLVVVFILGLIVGSFLNVVAYRYGTGQGVAKGRSKCFSCRKTLEWYELVPVISFLVLRARCSACKSKISWQYPLVELTTGLVFVGIFSTYGLMLTSVLFYVASALLIAIAVYDWHHMIIPDGLVYGLIVVSLIFSLITNPYNLIPSFGLFLFFASLWYFSGGRWMGFGDAKLAVGIGLLLGWPFGVSAVVLSFWLGTIIIGVVWLGRQLVHMLRSPKGRQLVKMNREIPFAPFLVLATLLVLIFQINVIPLV